jgi:hypothetical protein
LIREIRVKKLSRKSSKEIQMKNAELIWHNGRLKPWQAATCHVRTHALH